MYPSPVPVTIWSPTTSRPSPRAGRSSELLWDCANADGMPDLVEMWTSSIWMEGSPPTRYSGSTVRGPSGTSRGWMTSTSSSMSRQLTARTMTSDPTPWGDGGLTSTSTPTSSFCARTKRKKSKLNRHWGSLLTLIKHGQLVIVFILFFV